MDSAFAIHLIEHRNDKRINETKVEKPPNELNTIKKNSIEFESNTIY